MQGGLRAVPFAATVSDMNELPKLSTLTCLRCGHSWIPRQERLPLRCGKCGSPYWNIPKKK